MSTVKRSFPRFQSHNTETETFRAWYKQCLQDLDAGRHAVGCGCDETDSRWTPNGWDTSEERYMQNACSEIVRCALEMRSYECEEDLP